MASTQSGHSSSLANLHPVSIKDSSALLLSLASSYVLHPSPTLLLSSLLLPPYIQHQQQCRSRMLFVLRNRRNKASPLLSFLFWPLLFFSSSSRLICDINEIWQGRGRDGTATCKKKKQEGLLRSLGCGIHRTTLLWLLRVRN